MDREELRLSFRCDKRWDDLQGDGCRRHCGECDHEVIDLSAHTELGARVTLALHRGEEPPCVATCPAEALHFGPLDTLAERAAARLAGKLVAAPSSLPITLR